MRASLPRCARNPDLKGTKHYNDPRHPVTEKLVDVFGGFQSPRAERRVKFQKSHDRMPGKRAEIVSEQLCGRSLSSQRSRALQSLIHSTDDIIGYLAPSLEAYKGCTVIDVHPGACLWSSKLHDFLKPKRHILMEPEMRYYDQFIHPLLDKPGSTYRHSLLCGAHARSYWDNYRDLLDDKTMIPDRPKLEADDPNLRKLDTSILFTGNLWRKYPIKHMTRYVDHSSLILQHMTYAALTNDIFQRDGLVRMLWWAPDSTKALVFPTNLRGKRSYDMSLQMGASITEVAGVSHLENSGRKAKMDASRPPEMDAFVAGRVRREMAERGQVIPNSREHPVDLKPTTKEDDAHARDSFFKTTCTTTDDLVLAIEDYREHLVATDSLLRRLKTKLPRKRAINMDPSNFKDPYERHVRYQQSKDAIKSRPKDMFLNSSITASFRHVLAVDTLLRMLNLEANYAAVSDTNPNRKTLKALRNKILTLNEKYDAWVEQNISMSSMKIIGYLIDDLISLEAQPPTLARDRRPYEPLQAHPHEFWPQYDLTLLDFTPRSPDLSSPGITDRVEAAKACQEVIKIIYSSPAIPLTTALERLAPNAAKDLLPLVPEILDARKGGRMDPSRMSVRMLSQEMMDGLIRAFLEWPFRPSSVDMALAQGEGDSLYGDEDGDDVEPVE
jgi:transcription factor 1